MTDTLMRAVINNNDMHTERGIVHARRVLFMSIHGSYGTYGRQQMVTDRWTASD